MRAFSYVVHVEPVTVHIRSAVLRAMVQSMTSNPLSCQSVLRLRHARLYICGSLILEFAFASVFHSGILGCPPVVVDVGNSFR